MRHFLAAVVIVAAFASTSGCVIIPLPPATVEGRNAAKVIGTARSWSRPLKVARATRDDVRSRLGEPEQTGDGDWVYTWVTRTGLAVGFAWKSPPLDLIDRKRAMWLNFDDEDVLTAFYIVDDHIIGPGYALESPSPRQPLGESPFSGGQDERLDVNNY